VRINCLRNNHQISVRINCLRNNQQISVRINCLRNNQQISVRINCLRNNHQISVRINCLRNNHQISVRVKTLKIKKIINLQKHVPFKPKNMFHLNTKKWWGTAYGNQVMQWRSVFKLFLLWQRVMLSNTSKNFKIFTNYIIILTFFVWML
jgi:hypothetical protein